MSISIQTSTTERACRVAVSGEIDVSNAGELRTALDEALARDIDGLEVDLAEVPYIDSTGIGVLVGAAHHATETGAKLVVSHPQANVARVLTLLGMADDLGLTS